MRTVVCAVLLLLFGRGLVAEESVTICYNYGCLAEAEVLLPDAELQQWRDTLLLADSAAAERALLEQVIGRMYAYAGMRTPISQDKGGNLEDEAVNGRMDCIDHSTTTTRLLQVLARAGGLRFHTVRMPVERRRFIFAQHFSALIEERCDEAETACSVERGYVVDTWFRDNGMPAVILPLSAWMDGAGADE